MLTNADVVQEQSPERAAHEERIRVGLAVGENLAQAYAILDVITAATATIMLSNGDCKTAAEYCCIPYNSIEMTIRAAQNLIANAQTGLGLEVGSTN